jgi:hypothetical protein
VTLELRMAHASVEVTRGGITFHNLYSSLDIIRVIRNSKDEMGETCSTLRNAYNIIVRKTKGRM